ncbi:MAG TPA: hypothetical protein VK095_06455 [Beutenbergiaceae bacterium]|nr:hypothetical protein [Beutenbergiaceae bacterium]
MAQTPTKILYPTNADNWDPAGDMEALARSVHHFVPVANASERNALANDYNPTPARPLYVDRADTGTLERNAGDGWEPIGGGTMLLAEASLSGNVGGGTALTVPPTLRGTFRKYVVEIAASLAGADPLLNLVVRVNGDSGSNYTSHLTARYLDDRIRFQNASSTALPAVGFVGTSAGITRVTYSNRALGSTGLLMWTVEGWADTGTGGGANVVGGGKWSGTSALTSHFTVRTASSSDTWGSGAIARLWGYR